MTTLKSFLLTLCCFFCFATNAQYITTIAGKSTSGFSGDGLFAYNAQLGTPSSVFVDTKGVIFFADALNASVRRIDPDGLIHFVAGDSSLHQSGYNGDERIAFDAKLNSPRCVVTDTFGNVYIADYYNSRIRKVTTDGIIHTIAGNGINGFSGDGGAATEASLHYPAAIAFDTLGNLFIADTYNNRIRKIDLDGIISTVAGNSTSPEDFGFSGDGGLATNAKLHYPSGIVADRFANIYFSDTYNHRIRKITGGGIITTVAGDGNATYTGNNVDGLSASLNYPSNLGGDYDGNVYIADVQNHRVRKLAYNGIISTIAGTGGNGFSGDDGLAIQAQLNPEGVAVAGNGIFYIADGLNHRIRRVGPLDATPICPGGGTTFVASTNGSVFKWECDPRTGTFLPIDDDATYSGTSTNTLSLMNMPSNRYGYRYRCKSNGTYYGRINTISFANTWTGNTNSDWANAANWSCGLAPDSNTDVTISTGPVILNSNVTIHSLQLAPGVQFTVTTGHTLTILH